eukprot:6429028-Alexandrium_andersonii.AAC.1
MPTDWQPASRQDKLTDMNCAHTRMLATQPLLPPAAAAARPTTRPADKVKQRQLITQADWPDRRQIHAGRLA